MAAKPAKDQQQKTRDALRRKKKFARQDKFRRGFEATTFWAAVATPFLGAAGGGWLGAFGGVFSSTAGAVALGAAGAAVGFVGGAALGAAGFFAANSIYKNREYIVLGTLFLVTAPYALAVTGLKAAGKKLKAVKDKIFGSKKQPANAAAHTNTSVAPLKTGGGKTEKSVQKDFDKNAPKPAGNDNAKPATQKTKTKKPKTP
ncbi:MAG: hypothetical protein EA357_04475 [Micavibrio sp.]|nr:MAG: hypothetical protein EA357_04475 [Micavibrio sp.]